MPNILRSLPPWPDPQESIGRQIPSSRVRNRTVWWPQGPALDLFERVIQPEIENILRVVDLGHAELFIRLYMIGRTPESANPIVMVCCTNSKARDAAEATIRKSGLTERFKGFGLGGAALPLEHPAPVRRLSPNSSDTTLISSSAAASDSLFYSRPDPVSYLPMNPVVNNSSPLIIIDLLRSPNEPKPQSIVFASSREPSIGRHIFTPTSISHVSNRHATAGVVIQVGASYYQLTVGHLFEVEAKPFDEEELQMGLDECHFDGQSDYDEQDTDYEAEITGRGSTTPEAALSSTSSDSTNEENTRNYNSDMRRGPHSTFDTQHDGGKALAPERIQRPFDTKSGTSINKSPIGFLPCGRSFQAPIDYAIIAISSNSVESMAWRINNTPMLPCGYVEDIAEVGHEERKIDVAMKTSKVQGVLIPGKVTYRNRHAQFEKLVQVKLESEVFEGDSGSPVLDKSTGSLYGHIVMGVPGTKLAYIVQAVDIFRDIEVRVGKPVNIVDRRMIETPASGSHSLRDTSSVSSRESQYSTSTSIFSHASIASTSSSASVSGPNVMRFLGNRLPCEFVGYGGCEQTFALDEVNNWIEHIISVHLQGNLPNKVICWFCDNWIFDYKTVGDRRANFENRMWHIRSHILDEGMTAHHMRPDHFLTTHLQKHGLVPEHAYNVVRKYAEASQGPWIILHDEVAAQWEHQNTRRECEVYSPIEEERKHRKHRHKNRK